MLFFVERNLRPICVCCCIACTLANRDSFLTLDIKNKYTSVDSIQSSFFFTGSWAQTKPIPQSRSHTPVIIPYRTSPQEVRRVHAGMGIGWAEFIRYVYHSYRHIDVTAYFVRSAAIIRHLFDHEKYDRLHLPAGINSIFLPCFSHRPPVFSYSTAYQFIYYPPEQTARAREILGMVSQLQPLISELADQLLQVAQQCSNQALKDTLKNLEEKVRPVFYLWHLHSKK